MLVNEGKAEFVAKMSKLERNLIGISIFRQKRSDSYVSVSSLTCFKEVSGRCPRSLGTQTWGPPKMPISEFECRTSLLTTPPQSLFMQVLHKC